MELQLQPGSSAKRKGHSPGGAEIRPSISSAELSLRRRAGLWAAEGTAAMGGSWLHFCLEMDGCCMEKGCVSSSVLPSEGPL